MISIGANGKKISYGIKHYNVDTMAELATINPKKEQMGTTAFVLENSKYYMVDGTYAWKHIQPFGANTNGGGDTPPEDEDVIYNGGVIV